MSHDVLVSEVMALPIEQRLDLYRLLGDSLGPAVDEPPVSEDVIAELRRRLREHELDPDSAIPAEEVFEELEREP